MEYIIIIIAVIAFTLIVKYGLDIKLRKLKNIKEIGNNKQLNSITDKLPQNLQIAKDILNKLGNDTTKVKEEGNKETSLYIAINDTIIIANINNTFTRIQTIAHECIHSIQNRKILLFNFIYSNIYIIYFIIICLLTLFNLIEQPIVHVIILTLLGFIYYTIRSFLENDAMIKAKYIAKEYIESKNIITDEELKQIITNYDIMNEIGIKFTSFSFIVNISIKLIIYCICCII